jgi:hypothetical protein
MYSLSGRVELMMKAIALIRSAQFPQGPAFDAQRAALWMNKKTADPAGQAALSAYCASL